MVRCGVMCPAGPTPGPCAHFPLLHGRTHRELPPAFQPLFSFRYFNAIQSESWSQIWGSDMSMVRANYLTPAACLAGPLLRAELRLGPARPCMHALYGLMQDHEG